MRVQFWGFLSLFLLVCVLPCEGAEQNVLSQLSASISRSYQTLKSSTAYRDSLKKAQSVWKAAKESAVEAMNDLYQDQPKDVSYYDQLKESALTVVLCVAYLILSVVVSFLFSWSSGFFFFSMCFLAHTILGANWCLNMLVSFTALLFFFSALVVQNPIMAVVALGVVVITQWLVLPIIRSFVTPSGSNDYNRNQNFKDALVDLERRVDKRLDGIENKLERLLERSRND